MEKFYVTMRGFLHPFHFNWNMSMFLPHYVFIFSIKKRVVEGPKLRKMKAIKKIYYFTTARQASGTRHRTHKKKVVELKCKLKIGFQPYVSKEKEHDTKNYIKLLLSNGV